MKPETIQALTKQSEALLNTASLLPNPFVDKELLRRSADSRERTLRDEERIANYRAEEERKKMVLAMWATEVHCRLTPLLASLKEYRATVENHEGTLVVRAPGWDKWKDAEDDFHGILAKVEPIRAYTTRAKDRWRGDATVEGNFLNVTIAGKTSRHTKPSFGKIAESILTAVKENAAYIARRTAERDHKLSNASTIIEKFGSVVPLREEKKYETFGNNPRTRSVSHSVHTYINAVGPISSGEIFEAYNEPGKYGLRLNFVKMDEATLKQILFLLAGSQGEK